MTSHHYTEIPTSLNLAWELLPDYDVHRNISPRGVQFLSTKEIEVSNILRVSVKLISMTGSIEFLVKVLKIVPQDGSSEFEIHANFYDTNGEKEEEILELINSI